jgi:glycosyltransferase involved in cell wall biosynthesis
MRISVIMPCHNAGPWIAATLRSVGQQVYPAHEIIVIDDDSTDESLDQIGNAGVPVRVLQVRAHNAAAARNAGIEVATGDWIALLDADDLWYPNHLSRAVELLVKSNDVAFMSNHDWMNVRGDMVPFTEEFRCKLTTWRSGMNAEDFFKICQDGFHFCHSTVLYRLDRVRAVGMFDPNQRRRHDSDLWIRMIAGQTWTYDVVKSASYRIDTPGSLSSVEAECDFFYLRALVKNIDSVQGPIFREHLAREARRAMGIAFVNGPDDYYASIRDLACSHLPSRYWLFYRCASVWPSLARALLRTKRRYSRAPPVAAGASPTAGANSATR